MIKFTILGEQRPQGSKISHAIYNKSGAPVMKKGRVMTITRESCKYLPGWRNQVAEAALAVMQSRPLIPGAVKLSILFLMARPKSHYRTGRYAGLLKESAPPLPIGRPDTLKLARAVEDALTGVIWRDDSQVVFHWLAKRYGERFTTRVKITEF